MSVWYKVYSDVYLHKKPASGSVAAEICLKQKNMNICAIASHLMQIFSRQSNKYIRDIHSSNNEPFQ